MRSLVTAHVGLSASLAVPDAVCVASICVCVFFLFFFSRFHGLPVIASTRTRNEQLPAAASLQSQSQAADRWCLAGHSATAL
jgi:hypothetical protein